jgi:hypothetical protein
VSTTLKHALFVGLLLLACLVVYGDLIWRGEEMLSPFSDIVSQHLGTKAVLFRSMQEGHGIPFWRGDQLSGTPALTHPQSLYTYPLHVLFFLMPPAKAMGPTLWLHFLAAGLAFYALGTVLKLRPAARFLMALAAMFNYKLVAITFAGWLPVIPSLVFVPLLMAAVLHALERPGLSSALVAALAGALCLHTGHLQLSYYMVLFLTPYALLRAAQLWRARQRAQARTLALTLVFSGVLAAGMTAYLLVPMAAESPLISRSAVTYEYFLSGHALRPGQLRGFFTSAATQTEEFWEDAAYFGLVALALAAVGAALGRKRPHSIFLIVGFLLSMFLALETPLLRVAFDLVPGFALFRGPSRFLLLTSIFGIALAGIGAHHVLERAAAKLPRGSVTVVIGLLAVGIVADGAIQAAPLLRVAPWMAVQPTYPAVTLLPRAEYPAHVPAGTRAAPIERPTVNYGWAAPMGLQLVTGFDGYNFRHYQQYMDLMRYGRLSGREAVVWTDVDVIARVDMLNALNVGAVISSRPTSSPPPGMALAARLRDQPVFVFYQGMTTADLYVYRNTDASPRAWWAARVIAAGSEEAMMAAVNENDVRNVAVVLGTQSPVTAPAAGTIAIAEQRDGLLTANITAGGNQFLVLSEVWHPGWRATLDGQELPLVRTNIALMGAWISPGNHELRLQFRPMHWGVALGISLLSGVSLLALAVVVAMRQWGNGAVGQ